MNTDITHSQSVPEKEEEAPLPPPLAYLPLTKQLKTLENFFLVLSLSLSNLFVMFYISTIDQQLDSMNPSDLDKNEFYTSLFFYMLPVITLVGILAVGPLLDRGGVVVGMGVGRVCLLITSIILLVPVVELQIIGFVLLPFGNLLLWSATPDIILQIFGSLNFATIFGFGMTITGPVGAISFLFVSISLDLGTWAYVNAVLVVVQAVLFIVPWYFWRNYFRKGKIFETSLSNFP
mmetsp:Transcript_1544/g.2381  ORF Transcript_1544/g.2381 Transcript_1544/m.2381 type:complete len:234 (-) Transcript_1544:27-728(-)